ncbi:MAG: DUF1573 domain-containing protein [Bacillota bacterium]
MRNLLCDDFQAAVEECLVRHKSVLDVITKFQESNARVSRAVAKSVTSCGCLRVNAERQRIPQDITLPELRDYMDSHLDGKLCDHCKDVVETELGHNLFYISALCNLMELNLFDVILKERKRVSALGVFSFQ